MPALSEYLNVSDSALALLNQKGYQLWYDREHSLFYCEKSGWDFAADTPCGLLGLVAIYEERNPDHFSEYWWKINTDLDQRDLSDEPQAYVPIWQNTDPASDS